MSGKAKAIFLDRDGTLNIEKNYLFRFEDWEWIPGAVEALKNFQHLNYVLIIVTNQAGVARGFYTEDDIHALHKSIDIFLKNEGIEIKKYMYCPHHPEYGVVDDCNCRKPKPGMLLEAAKLFNIDLDSSWIIGDSLTDIQAGLACGVRGVLVNSGHPITLTRGAVCVCPDILAASNYILSIDK